MEIRFDLHLPYSLTLNCSNSLALCAWAEPRAHFCSHSLLDPKLLAFPLQPANRNSFGWIFFGFNRNKKKKDPSRLGSSSHLAFLPLCVIKIAQLGASHAALLHAFALVHRIIAKIGLICIFGALSPKCPFAIATSSFCSSFPSLFLLFLSLLHRLLPSLPDGTTNAPFAFHRFGHFFLAYALGSVRTLGPNSLGRLIIRRLALLGHQK